MGCHVGDGLYMPCIAIGERTLKNWRDVFQRGEEKNFYTIADFWVNAEHNEAPSIIVHLVLEQPRLFQQPLIDVQPDLTKWEGTCVYSQNKKKSKGKGMQTSNTAESKGLNIQPGDEWPSPDNLCGQRKLWTPNGCCEDHKNIGGHSEDKDWCWVSTQLSTILVWNDVADTPLGALPSGC